MSKGFQTGSLFLKLITRIFSQPLVIGLVLFTLGLYSGISLFRSYAQNRLNTISDAISVGRNFKGLLLDSTGVGALTLKLMEQQDLFFVYYIRVGVGSDKPQIFESQFSAPGSLSFPTLPLTQFFLEKTNPEHEISVGLRLSTHACLVLLFFSIGLGLCGIILVTLIRRRKEKEASEAVARGIAQLSAQVVHDIRSPLAALISIVHNMHGLDAESKMQLRTVANRIRDIANNLLLERRLGFKSFEVSNIKANSPLSEETCTIELLPTLLEKTLSEKRAQYFGSHKIEIEADFMHGLFASVQRTELARIISNLVDNSVEALNGKGRIVLKLVSDNNNLVISVEDNGRGISPDILSRLGRWGETHGKSTGSGFGLYHAKTTTESWGGSFEIKSEENRGTSVKLVLPRAVTPEWFVAELRILKCSTVIVLDDDQLVHNIWAQRLEGITLVHLYEPKEILAWYRENFLKTRTIYLCDHELANCSETGLDIIEKLGIASDAILVTNSADEPSVRSRCQKFGIRIIPKNLAGLIPIVVE